MAYEGPKGPWAIAELLLYEYGLNDMPGIKFEWWWVEGYLYVFRFALPNCPMRIRVLYEFS